MTETQDPKQTKQPSENKAKKQLSPLEAKRAQNLRDNLLKRKLQARARMSNDADEQSTDQED